MFTASRKAVQLYVMTARFGASNKHALNLQVKFIFHIARDWHNSRASSFVRAQLNCVLKMLF